MTLIGAVATVFLVLQLAVNSLLFMTYFQVVDCMQQFTFYENPRIARYFDDRHLGVASLELLAFKRGGVYGPIESVRAIAGNDVQTLLKIIGDPKHKEHKEMISWLKGHVIKYHPYQPDVFDPRKVVFSDPKKRLKMVLEGMGL
jgi:hypothetical protein